MKRERLNCPNCGSVIENYKCAYCGTVFYDFADVDIAGQPTYMRLRLHGGKIATVKACCYEAEVSIDDSCIPYMADDLLHPTAAIVARPPTYILNLTFIVEEVQK